MDQQDLFSASSGSHQQENSLWQQSKVLDHIAFFGFAVLLFIGTWCHELWGDELHSWNLARSSSSMGQLFSNIRFEGHPPLWYVLLYGLSRLTANVDMIQVLHCFIALTGAWLLVFRLHIYSIHKVLVLAGYFFLYEYGILSRNYSLAIVFALSIILLRNRDSKYDLFFYYFFLLLISLTHILGLFLGLALHFAFTIKHFSTWYSRKALLELLSGLLIVSPALFLIFPPSSGSLNIDFWREHWSSQQFKIMVEAPLKAFLPVPAWWQRHSWNTEFLLHLQQRWPFIKLLTLCLSILFIYVVYYILRPHRLSLNVFFVNLLLTFFFAFIFPLTSIRYVGFIYIGFIISLLLGYHTLIQFRKRRILIWILLTLQMVAAAPSYFTDLRRPFSQSREIRELISSVDLNYLVTDYWTLNYLSAAVDKPIFCVGFNQNKRFIRWDSKMKELMKNKVVYSEGFDAFLGTHDTDSLYLLSTHTLESLLQRDLNLHPNFEIQLVDERTGSIESYSDLFLYKVKTHDAK